jgi:cell division septum initiation protein DivIVA
MTDLQHAELAHEQAKRYLRRLMEEARQRRSDRLTRAIAIAHVRVSRTLAALEAMHPASEMESEANTTTTNTPCPERI